MAKYTKQIKTALTVVGFSLLAAAVLIIVLIPQIKGYHSYLIMSESMEPTLSRGDIIEVEAIPEKVITPGEIITVKSGDGDVTFTHRVLYIDAGTNLIYTKGDANATQDLYPIKYEQVLGRVVYKIPYAGKLVLLFREGD